MARFFTFPPPQIIYSATAGTFVMPPLPLFLNPRRHHHHPSSHSIMSSHFLVKILRSKSPIFFCDQN